MPDPSQGGYDAVVIGSGFGGVFAAHELVGAGWRVLLLERGGWVERGPENWDAVRGFFQLTPAYTTETVYRVHHRGRVGWEGICACVGGPSVFYGGAAFRFREEDFAPGPELVGGSGAEWPIGYAELEPFYSRAEQLLGIAGEAGADPTEPYRSVPYPRTPAPLAGISGRIAAAARRLGLHPFRIPLALGEACVACGTCDAYACAVGAKNDLATTLVPRLERTGRLEVRPYTVVTRLREAGGRIVAVEARDARRDQPLSFRADTVVLSAGALASPHLLLASGLERLNPAGGAVGRFLMRHCNAFVYGFFGAEPNPGGGHHKQVAIHDYYFGDDPGSDAPPGKLGNIQQIMHPQVGAILRGPARALDRLRAGGGRAERSLARVTRILARHLTGLQVIAEDQPRPENRVAVDAAERDRFGLPRPRIHHDYSSRDLRARAALVRRAKRILREAGAWFIPYVHEVETFSHAVGTVRMGADPRTAPLDVECRFRGIENLYVVDGSFMPTSGGVNPSLTIAANALRVGSLLAQGR